MTRWILRITVVAYVAALILAPLYMVVRTAFEHGADALWTAVTTDAGIHALQLTLVALAVSTVVNTIFGVACALLIVRRPSRATAVISAIVDLPFAISPVVVGLALVLTFGVNGWFGTWLVAHGTQVIFATPGIVLATVFVTVPFVVREVVPVLEEVGHEQEEAAQMLGASAWAIFWRITLPSIRWGVAYGVVLTVARALGEYGAVAVVAGNIVGRTETLTVHIKERNDAFDNVAVYGSALLLAAIAVLVLAGMTIFSRSAVDRATSRDRD